MIRALHTRRNDGDYWLRTSGYDHQPVNVWVGAITRFVTRAAHIIPAPPLYHKHDICDMCADVSNAHAHTATYIQHPSTRGYGLHMCAQHHHQLDVLIIKYQTYVRL